MHAVGSRTAVAAIGLTVLLCVVAISGREPLRDSTEEAAPQHDVAENVTVVPPTRGFPVPGALPPEEFVIEEEPGTRAWLRVAVACLAFGAIVTGGVVFVRNFRGWGTRRRGRRRAAPSEEDPRETEPATPVTEDDTDVARRGVEAALVPLREPTDPRGAVIAAYARLEEVLAQRDLGRRAPEAPREYLSRVLVEQGMPERSLTALTSLFEEARFSLHPIPESAPRRARSELENARAALAATDERC
jgi:predicted nucleic acid-binding protein